MKKNFKVMMGLLFAINVCTTSLAAQDEAEELPFLKSPYLHEYLHEAKTSMNGNVVSESKTETTYDDNNRIVSMITTSNGAKTMELIDYVYGDRTRSNSANMYMNGTKMMSMKTKSEFCDDIYRNMTMNETVTEQNGSISTQRNEWTYDDKGRIIGMKQYLNGELQMEQLNYNWTPNSCTYDEITYLPFKSSGKVSKQFKDDYYVQNVLEIHEKDMNGVKMETRMECAYDDNGNIISIKNYTNGNLFSEFKDYVWGDKKSTHTEITYMNGTPMSIVEVTQYYK